MSTQNCPSLWYGHEGPVAQTLFLGSSVVNFNANMGWGGQASSVTVDLIDDIGYDKCTDVRNGAAVFKGNHGNNPNHYYTCKGDECYIDSEGKSFTPEANNPTKMKFRPGKVYYQFDNEKGFVSKYWRKRDPGFFGNLTSKDPVSGSFGQMVQYDIIGTPVYFKCENFSFGGIVQSWDRNVGTGGLSYSVNLQGPDDILSNCWMIIGEYSGSVFTSNTAGYGLPMNYSTNAMSGRGTIGKGALHNVFNIYGFLESFGVDSFGVARLNDNGINANVIVDALQILTSSVQQNDYKDDLDWFNKNRFSPFGRVLIKGMVEAATLNYASTNINSFGAIPWVLDSLGQKRWPCILDISQLPRMPDDYRVQGPIISVMDFIRQLTTDSGYDFYLEMFPTVINNQVLNVIKLHTVSRNINLSSNVIESTIRTAENSGFSISTSTLGKEANSANVRSLIVGPNIQRLYQAKNYRLAYHQTNFILNPLTLKFINYREPVVRVPSVNVSMPAGNNGYVGKVKMPNGYSMRNPALSRYVNGNLFTDVLNASEGIRGINFDTEDQKWKDNEIEAPTSTKVPVGNYFFTSIIKRNSGNRFLPLYDDVICPFFGYQGEETVELSTSEDPNVFKRVRPVWLDTWTGQINVVMYTHELPQISVPLTTLYGGGGLFSITESEMRAIKQGTDSYLIYCCSKMFKPDLFIMLVNAYVAAGHLAGGLATFSHFGENNMSNTTGGPDIPRPASGAPMETVMMELFLTPNFIRDFEILSEFVSKIASYYGTKYMVKMPSTRSYQDYQYFTPTTEGVDANAFTVYRGSGKIFYSYEPASEAWEEQGNMIDDSISVGSASFWSLASDNGTIPPIIGYNASSNFDLVRGLMSTFTTIKDWYATLSAGFTVDASSDWATGNYNIDLFMQWLSAKTPPYLYSSIDTSNLDRANYTVIDHVPFIDGFGDRSADHKKLYSKTSIQEKLIFLYPEQLLEPRIIIDGLGLQLTQNSLAYEADPSRTVIANVSIEDLAMCMNVTNNTLSPQVIDYFLQYVFPAGIGGAFIRNSPANNGVASAFAAMSPKVAHPFFAAIPVKSKLYSYGPWTNYPDLIKNEIYPGIATPHVENLIGGVTVDYDPDLVPWNYGNMSLLDSVAMKKVQSNANYQQVLETASLQTPGLPIFGIGARFDTPNAIQYNDKRDEVVHNNITYTIDKTYSLQYKDKKAQPAAIMPIIPNLGTVMYSPPQSESYTEVLHNYYIIRAIPSNYNPMAPIVTNVSMSMSNDITSTYTFRTATRKLGLFNKIDSDRIKNIALQNNKRNRQIYSLINSGFNQTNSENMSLALKVQAGSNAQTLAGGIGGEEATNSLRKKFYGWSPGTMMIGSSAPFIHGSLIKEWTEKTIADSGTGDDDKSGKSTNKKVQKQLVSALAHGSDPGDNFDELAAKPVEAFYKKRRQQVYVGNYVGSEARIELGKNYNAKAFMSMDGLFSPISFYPTVGWSTYAMTQYPTSECPMCGGTSKITDTIVDYSKFTALRFRRQPITYKCVYCSKKRDIPYDDGTKKSSSSIEILPPYIVTSGSDIRNLIDMESNKTSSPQQTSSSSTTKKQNVSVPIHRNTLQPIVVPYGEFKNTNVHMSGIKTGATVDANHVDKSRHCIQIIGRFDAPPKSNVNLATTFNLSSYFDPVSGARVPLSQKKGVNIDYFDYDIVNKTPSGKRPLNNMRFLGLRGPLMLHGWGYDTDGYPVPNAADEPRSYDTATGRPMRFKIKTTETPTTFKSIEKGKTFKYPVKDAENKILFYAEYIKGDGPMFVRKTLSSYGLVQDNESVTQVDTQNDLNQTGTFWDNDPTTLGDVITRQYEWDGKQWTNIGKSNKFHLNWAERPELWPVGPVDLRWDHKRKLWTMNSGGATLYKMVHIVLEEDLTKDDDFDETYPAKGFLDDAEYSTEKLPLDFRRLVYIKDTGGYTAPRGAKLLCRYNPDSGFYEPISKPSFVCYGLLGSGNTATIELSYIQGRKRAENNPTMNVYFENPFGFNIVRGNKGLFTFIAGKWNLTATK